MSGSKFHRHLIAAFASLLMSTIAVGAAVAPAQVSAAHSGSCYLCLNWNRSRPVRPSAFRGRPKTGQETTIRFAPLSGILSGPIFTRTRDIIAANMTELLDRSEDPARMIRMIINEMEETLVEVRATAARSIADIKEMRRACNRLDDLQHGWTEKAELALEKGREDLARAALGEKQKAAEMAEGLHAEIVADRAGAARL